MQEPIDRIVNTPSGKLTASMVLGIVGGVFGIMAAIVALFIGGLGGALGGEGAGEVAGLGFVAIFLAVAGIVGGALAKSKPVAAAWLQLGAGIFGFIAVSLAWLIAGPLLLIGALLAFLGRPRQSL
ncbi:MAG: hypothetical protein M3360_05950 [Actinomycetota bacterium]|nr:hypothetical protein [Actinomycetota bacterium]